METVTLSHKTTSGEILEAVFAPSHGMNLLHFKRGSRDVIDQSTKQQFEERFAGHGALIGPHFHRRKVVPAIKDESLFPHIAFCKAQKINDPFSHGVGRYAPWKYEATENTIKAVLTGKEEWNGMPLSAIEGQNFKMVYEAELKSDGLHIALSVVSDTDSLIGLHYYYALPQKKGFVKSEIQAHYLDQGIKKPLRSTWNVREGHHLTFDLQEEADYTFHSFPHPLQASIVLDAIDYQLRVHYSCDSQENAWQLYHPKDASYVCIEPISAQDPRHPNLTVSSLNIHLEILS